MIIISLKVQQISHALHIALYIKFSHKLPKILTSYKVFATIQFSSDSANNKNICGNSLDKIILQHKVIVLRYVKPLLVKCNGIMTVMYTLPLNSKLCYHFHLYNLKCSHLLLLYKCLTFLQWKLQLIYIPTLAFLRHNPSLSGRSPVPSP